MKKANSYNWILRIVDHTGERYELKLDYTLSNMRKLMRSIRCRIVKLQKMVLKLSMLLLVILKTLTIMVM